MEKRVMRYFMLALDIHLEEVALAYTLNANDEDAQVVERARSILRFTQQQVMDSDLEDALHALERLTKDLRKVNDKALHEKSL